MTTEESYTQKKQTDGSHDFQISPSDCFPIHHSIATTLYSFVSPIHYQLSKKTTDLYVFSFRFEKIVFEYLGK